MRGNNPILALKLHILLQTFISWWNLSVSYEILCPSNLYNSSSFDETIKMRGNNPILALKLHILLTHLHLILRGNLALKLHILLLENICPSNLYNSSSFDETIKMRGNNPILALKLHILLCILMKSIRMSFKPL